MKKIYRKKRKKKGREGGRKGEGRIITHVSLYWVWVEQAGEWEGRPHNEIMSTPVWCWIQRYFITLLKQTKIFWNKHIKTSHFFFQWTMVILGHKARIVVNPILLTSGPKNKIHNSRERKNNRVKEAYETRGWSWQNL